MSTTLEDFARDYGQTLVALAYALTGSRAEAEDIAQEVFTRLSRINLDLIADPKAYARRAIYNEVASWGRRVSRQTVRRRALEGEWDRVLSIQPDPHGRVEVMSALSRLGERQRAAVVMRYDLALSDQEIAESLGCAPATVRSLLSRGLHKLRNELECDVKAKEALQ